MRRLLGARIQFVPVWLQFETIEGRVSASSSKRPIVNRISLPADGEQRMGASLAEVVVVNGAKPKIAL